MGDKLKLVPISVWQEYLQADDFGNIYLRSHPNIPLSQGHTALTRSGHTQKRYRTFYVGGVVNKSVLAHRLLWILWYGEYPDVIDHIDRDTLNNAKSNLRNITMKGNAANRSKGIRLKPNRHIILQYSSSVKRQYVKLSHDYKQR